MIRREEYDVDAQEVRSYFDFAQVRQGLLDVTGRLFGLTYRAVEDAPRWHDEVTAYDVSLTDDDGDSLLGRIYLDLHPRDGQVQARRAVRPDHAGRRRACSCPRACSSATSRAA